MINKKAYIFIIAIIVCGCSMIPIKESEFNLPNQNIYDQSQQNNHRVIFFNASNAFLYPASGTINIKLNQKHVATLKIGRFVQVNILPGEYDLYLDHWDIVHWKSDYKLSVDNSATFVKVFAKLTSTGYEVVSALPEEFERDYKPAYKNK